MSNPFAPDRFERDELHADARRFEDGMPNFSALFVLRNAPRVLGGVGIDAIERHSGALAALLLSGFRELGLEPFTPDDPAQRAGIVSASLPDSERLVAAPAREGVHVWGREGCPRASVHAYLVGNRCRELRRSMPAAVGAASHCGWHDGRTP